MSAVGDWSTPGDPPGSEPTVAVELEQAKDYEQVKAFFAAMGHIGNQIAVVSFMDDEHGQQAVYSFDSPSSREELQKSLNAHCVQFRTLQEMNGFTRVSVFDEHPEQSGVQESLGKVANEHGAREITARRVHGEVWPSWDETGGSRDKSAAVYTAFLADYNRRHPGQGYNPEGSSRGNFDRRSAGWLAEQFRRIEAERVT